MKSRVIRCYQYGEPKEVLKIESRSLSAPEPGEILVRMKARPINPSDLIPIRGMYAHRTHLPLVPGYEGVGIVEKIGPSVSPSLLGKRVLPLRGEGTWQEIVKSSAIWAIPIPNTLDDESASQLYINPVTAWIICSDVLQLKQGDIIVMNACGSSIGRIFAQLSMIFGFRLIAVTRNNIHTDDLLKLGAWKVIDSSKLPLYEAVMELTNGRGAKTVIDSVGGVYGTELIKCVQKGGVFLSIGLLSGIQIDWAKAKETGVTGKLFLLRHWIQNISYLQWQKTFEHIIELVVQGKLKMQSVAERFELYDFKSAIRATEAPKRRGKVLLTSIDSYI
ncbi:zinc-dependent alcohol dehydrogenase family protein [Thermoflavimicrobium daqui]|jgi:NADPH:quinone reductase-like Zn-dependent oxidoreductase|uniref:Alcohol dehydrogenase n=1 Tax=Thermoflavimicrobium daqui TaxID=2137476 RepID=A0A364K3Z8_9BACL|nr:zinc-dependent alcohol dehydrogenase family protein [Thermoflavimicrobium daqui]RAL24082.1 alcohol dehydrogenase [Thermoflavimicrobium daqui]